MAREFPPIPQVSRFPCGPGRGIVAARKEPAMDPDTTPQEQEAESVSQTPRPRLRDFLWRSRAVRFWLAASLVWWAGFVLSLNVDFLKDFYQTLTADFVSLVFHPFTIAVVVGFRFIRAEFKHGLWVSVPPTHEQMFPPLSVGGMVDPASDPLDPRSGLHWQHFHQNH